MSRFVTVGHSNRTLDHFLGMLREAGVARVVDVRRLPGSAKYPWFDQEPLAAALAAEGIAYVHEAGLTGRRPRQPGVDDGVNAFWENRSFHNYADHALSDEFGSALDDIAGQAVRQALMCSEAVWWRCHRRIIADHLLARGEEVTHLMDLGTSMPARLTAGAVIHPDGTVTYPAAGS